MPPLARHGDREEPSGGFETSAELRRDERMRRDDYEMRRDEYEGRGYAARRRNPFPTILTILVAIFAIGLVLYLVLR